MKDCQVRAPSTRSGIGLLLGLSILLLASCNDKPDGASTPAGQVVATVGGDEVTLRELNMELQTIPPSNNPEVAKASEQAALNVIINRKILAKAARDQKLGESAQFQLAKRRADELMLAQALQSDISSKVRRPTRDETQRYIDQHPHSFAQRKIFSVDQIEFSRNINPSITKAMVPQRTLQDVEQILLKNGIEYRRLPGSIDARGAHPQFIDQISKLPPNALFIVQNRDKLVAHQIREARVTPFTGEPAIQMAQQILRKQRVDEELQRRGEQIRKAAGEIKYKKGYEALPAQKAPATPVSSSPTNSPAPTPS